MEHSFDIDREILIYIRKALRDQTNLPGEGYQAFKESVEVSEELLKKVNTWLNNGYPNEVQLSALESENIVFAVYESPRKSIKRKAFRESLLKAYSKHNPSIKHFKIQ